LASWKKLTAAVALASVLLIGLTGCGAAPTTQIFEGFEKASAAEADVAEAVKTLSTLEAKDSKQYNSILSQGKQDNRNVQTLIDNSSKSLEERTQAMDQLKSMLDDARKKMGELDGAISNLKEEGLKKQATEAYNAYVKRYETFTSMYEKYGKWIQQEQALYNELKQKDTKLKTITKAVSDRNEAYRQVEQLKIQFNEYTKSFNTKKSEFYKEAGMQVTGTEKTEGEGATS